MKDLKLIFKMLFWLARTIFKILSYLVRDILGLKQKQDKVKFDGKVITDKDFVVLNRRFAKDATYVYYRSRAFNFADVQTFEALDDHYAKDRNKAYYCDQYREGQNYYLTKKQTIIEIEGAHPASFVSLNHGYAKDNNQAYFQGRCLEVKDVSSYVCIDNYFTKDDVSAYLNLHPITGSDGKTFEVTNGNFARDASNIYYYGYTGEGQNNICILPCDRQSFQILDNHYSKDNVTVFFLGFILKGADGATFEILTEGYSKDKNSVYFKDKKIPDADSKTFEVCKENGEYGHDFNYAKDQYAVFMDDKRLREADVASFKVLGENYGCDKKQVYYKTKVVKGANPRTFSVYPHDFGNADAEDSHAKFHEGSRVGGL